MERPLEFILMRRCAARQVSFWVKWLRRCWHAASMLDNGMLAAPQWVLPCAGHLLRRRCSADRLRGRPM